MEQNNWYDEPQPDIEWLVDGLITSDGHAAFVGKPKAGKSQLIRNLVASVVKGHPFLGRKVNLPPNTGRVLYIHLDRKDRDWRVARELRQLGITRADSSRIALRTAGDIEQGASVSERLEWLKEQVKESKPNLIVVDLLWQFVSVDNANEYAAVLKRVNQLQDALRDIKYAGALVVALHARKAVSLTDSSDNILGSQAQLGSFGTVLDAVHRKTQKVYTVSSDQTDRDDLIGELIETVVVQNPDKTLELGCPFGDLIQVQKKADLENSLQQLALFVADNPGVDTDVLVSQLSHSKKTVLRLLNEAVTSEMIRREGTGIKGDPFRYFAIGSKGDQHAEPIAA